MEGSKVKQGDVVYHDGQTKYEVVDVHDDGSVDVALVIVDDEGEDTGERGGVALYSEDLYRAHFSSKEGDAPPAAGQPDERGSHFPPS